MSKEGEGLIGENDKKDETPESVILTIEFHQNGKINVNGPITNEMLSFFLLEKAKDIIKAHNLKIAYQEAQSKIHKPGGMLGFARRRN